jgi:DNA-binding XRE family transcriptional regulator
MNSQNFALGQVQQIVSGGEVTHVIVPVNEYKRLLDLADQPTAEEVDIAVAALTDPNTEWLDADEVLGDLLRDGLAKVRKEHGLTQEQLAAALGVSQPHVSRLEKNLDSSPLRLVKKLAELLFTHSAEQRRSA